MKKIPVLCLSLAFIMASCSQHESADKKSVEIIKLKEAFENRKSITINDISINFEYVRLETKDECLTDTRLAVYSDDQYLIAIDQKKILLFDRYDGKFIREIGHMGNGPGEYSRTYNVMPYNEKNNIIYAGRNRKRYGYSLDGQLRDTLSLPELVSEIGNIDDNIFAAFLPDYQGGEKNKIIIFNHKGSLLKTFPNYLSAPITSSFFAWNPNSWFYIINKQLYFYQLFNDTLFHVKENSITPRYVFIMGEYSPPYEMKTSPIFEPDKYFIMKTIQESSKYLFCSFNFNKKNYTAIFDKNKRTTVVNEYCPESGHGFINNINDFVPLEFSSINEKDELTCTIDAFKIKQWFDLNPEKVNQLPKYLIALKNIQETSNPVIIIAKLKNK
ncbi:MAG: 6-bladed beta-propeller [Bacteroidales bacterium]|nr:6-bladed beta-propeller [Bacteroidales bacterium]